MRSLTLLFSILLLSACANQRSNQSRHGSPAESSSSAINLSDLASSDYENNLVYPQSVYSLQFVTQKTFDDPIWGTQLRYAHIFSENDIVDVFVYPIAATNWDNEVATLMHENQKVLDEINEAVKRKHYKAVKVEKTGEIKFGEWQGVKSSLDLTMNDGKLYRSFVFLFIQQDKFIKVRFSLLKGKDLGLPDENVIARELITAITVPAESAYMLAMREQHREQRAQELLRMLIEAAGQQKKTEPSTQ
ncbi:hypothetical protein [Aliikangiella coralliicola]|uniref:DUF3313 domain-containing protein n=1 Tax=Aliikangiella coralliicola TaxID=2592383 RepID=A0A545UDL2_9GAMM|nr:hypothetical protein [Aliikangiella coralliicola]TQV87557.1 hypothetical protein FLL46_11845 [Aliikangiella coralliicola]